MAPQDSSSTQPTTFHAFCNAVYNMVDGPVVWFRNTVVEPNHQDYNWYHRQFRRVPTIDQCYVDDPVCKFEANQQFKRDKWCPPMSFSSPALKFPFQFVPDPDLFETSPRRACAGLPCPEKVLSRMVDNEVLNILRQRFEDCISWEAPDQVVKCRPLKDTLDEATTNWFIKYGDLGAYGNAETALTKQKNRLIWERRHGPVGSVKAQPASE